MESTRVNTGAAPGPASMLDLLGRLLEMPGDDFHDIVARCRDCAGHGQAGRFFAEFADRIGDLTLDERRELYDETLAAIGAPAPAGDGTLPSVSVLGGLHEALQQAGRTAGPAAAAPITDHVLPAIERMLPTLEAARNPFSLLLKSICCAALDLLRDSDPSRD